MHLFRSILNAHFLRYVTLVVVACFIFCAQLSVQYVKTDIQNTDIAATSTTRTTFNIGNTVFAADTGTGTTEATQASDLNIISLLNTAIGLVSLIYVPFSMLSSWLLSPDWTFGDFIHLRPVLHSLWIFVSNTVYVVFAAMLIVVAIANIFGQSDSYAIKKMLPRFIIGVIMVPFTWWVVSATLSVSSYMTALVLRMPADIIMQNSSINTANVEMAKHCTLNFDAQSNNKKIWSCDPPAKIDLAEYFLQSDGAYGIIPMYAYNVFKFNQLDEFKNTLNGTGTLADAHKIVDTDTSYTTGDSATKNAMLQAAIIATSIGKIGIQLMMSVIFAVVFVVILIALVLVLFTRVIKMWMYAIFSPLFALKFFLDDKVKQESALGAFKFGDFIALAMVPVVVSAALGFGFMFIMTFKSHMEQSTTNKAGIESGYIKVTDNTANSGSIQFFGTTIDIKMSAENSSGVGADGKPVQAGDLKMALFNVLSGLITPIFGIVILWMAVMAAIKTSVVAGKAVEGIEKLGGEAVGMAKKLPNFIPVGSVKSKDGEKIPITIGGLKKVPNILDDVYNKIDNEKASSMRRAMGFDAGKFEALNSALASATGNFEKLDNAMITQGFVRDRTSADMMQDGMKQGVKQYAEKRWSLNIDTSSSATYEAGLKELHQKLQRANMTDIGNADEFVRRYKAGGDQLVGLINTNKTPLDAAQTFKKDDDKIKFQHNGSDIEFDIPTSSKIGDEKAKDLKKGIKEALEAKGYTGGDHVIDTIYNLIK